MADDVIEYMEKRTLNERQNSAEAEQADLADGDHFAGMPESVHQDDEGNPTSPGHRETRDQVINEITNEVDSGDAHLMTRNELVEFIDWWVNHERLDANEVIYLAMEHGERGAHDFVVLDTIKQKLAKEFFILKGYENEDSLPFPHDPVHHEDGRWFFWNEVWADRIGPYDSEAEARVMLSKYIKEELGVGKPEA